MSEAALHAALAEAQAQYPAFERSKTVTVKTKTGGSYSFSYCPFDRITHILQGILPPLGLSYAQMLDESETGAPALTTIVLHKDGAFIKGTMPLPPSAASMSPQEFGSLVTYMRRYALTAALGIATEDDDDGNHASGNVAKARRGSPVPPVEKAAGASKDTPPERSSALAAPSPVDDIPFAPDMPDVEPEQETFPTPESLNVLSEKQSKMIAAVGTKLVNAGATTVDDIRAKCSEVSGGRTSSRAKLTKKEASAVIDWLKELEAA